MTTLTRATFNQKLEARELRLTDAANASAELGAAAAAVDANGDGVVTGAETDALFLKIDDFDTNGARNSILAADSSGLTLQGQMANDAISLSVLSVRSSNVTLSRAAFNTQFRGREVSVASAAARHQKLGDAARNADKNNDGVVHGWESDALFLEVDDVDFNGDRNSIMSATPIAETEAGAMANALLEVSTVSTRQVGRLSVDMLKAIVPQLTDARAGEIIQPLNDAMNEAGIDMKSEIAAFVAQLAHESVGFRFFEEIASGAAYEGRLDLGNTQPGDGRRFKGPGPIQLTGRANYRAAGQDLGIDLIADPARAADVDVGFRVSAWYWNSRDINTPARAGDFITVTRRINGGLNGLADRRRYYNRALAVL